MAFEIIRDMEPRSLKLKLNTGTQDPILEKQPAEYLKVWKYLSPKKDDQAALKGISLGI